MAQDESRTQRVVYALLGLNQAGQYLYRALLVLGFAGFVFYKVWMLSARFSEAEEHLFRGARHGDLAAIEQSLRDGANVNAAAPIDGKTALFRAAILGQKEAVRLLIERGADPNARSLDGHTPLDIVEAARAEEKDVSHAQALDAIAELLRGKAAAQ